MLNIFALLIYRQLQGPPIPLLLVEKYRQITTMLKGGRPKHSSITVERVPMKLMGLPAVSEELRLTTLRTARPTDRTASRGPRWDAVSPTGGQRRCVVRRRHSNHRGAMLSAFPVRRAPTPSTRRLDLSRVNEHFLSGKRRVAHSSVPCDLRLAPCAV